MGSKADGERQVETCLLLPSALRKTGLTCPCTLLPGLRTSPRVGTANRLRKRLEDGVLVTQQRSQVPTKALGEEAEKGGHSRHRGWKARPWLLVEAGFESKEKNEMHPESQTGD